MSEISNESLNQTPPDYAGIGSPSCVIESLNRHGRITDRQWHAGMALKNLAWSRRNYTEGSELWHAATDRIEALMASLDTSMQWIAVFSVCCYGDSAVGKLGDLQRGLDRLADHWRVPANYVRTNDNDRRF